MSRKSILLPKTNDYYIVACKHYIIEYGFLVHDGHCLITKLSSVVSAEIEIKGEKIGERKKFTNGIKMKALKSKPIKSVELY